MIKYPDKGHLREKGFNWPTVPDDIIAGTSRGQDMKDLVISHPDKSCGILSGIELMHTC